MAEPLNIDSIISRLLEGKSSSSSWSPMSSSSMVPALIATSSEVLLFVETPAAAATADIGSPFTRQYPQTTNSTISLIIPAAAAHDDDFSLMNADDSGESCGCCFCSLACLPATLSLPAFLCCNPHLFTILPLCMLFSVFSSCLTLSSLLFPSLPP